MVRVALAQTKVGADKRGNLEAVAERAAEASARSARLIVFPEASMYHFGRQNDPLAPAAETLEGPFVTRLSELAQKNRLWILAGMFERTDDAALVYNTLVLVDDTGTLRGTYRKMHLYDAFGYRESDRMRPGDGELLSFTIDGMRFGALTCYDLRFPETARHHAEAGADAVVIPTAWLAGPLKEMHLTTLLQARAIENTMYVGCADQCTEGYCGNSVLFDPLGVVVVSLGEAPGLVVGEMSTERIAEVRARNPSLANARRDLYARWTEGPAALRR
ncbi:MAG: carbon-nitrogen hydrolase family protein [Candidatus Eremiobacteraeota bacterium]|nr:carbon-nitrogen hydrolase family protein [Candidatus Eremiobacteraeota bacterium]